MNVSFRFLWLFWFGGVLYSFCATAIGIFPDRTLADRLSERFGEAWFIFGAWVVVLIYRARVQHTEQADG